MFTTLVLDFTLGIILCLSLCTLRGVTILDINPMKHTSFLSVYNSLEKQNVLKFIIFYFNFEFSTEVLPSVEW